MDGGGVVGEEDGGGGGGDTVVSPESGISSASPLSSPSLHPDSSPVLQTRQAQVSVPDMNKIPVRHVPVPII